MAANTINHRTLAELVEAGVVRTARVVGLNGGWGVIVKDRRIERTLAAQRGGVRLFRKLETVVVYLGGVGIGRFDVDAVKYGPGRTTRRRPDRAAALKQTHEAAAYDKWFRQQVHAALDDSRPSITHEEISAHLAKKRTRLLKKAGAGREAKA